MCWQKALHFRKDEPDFDLLPLRREVHSCGRRFDGTLYLFRDISNYTTQLYFSTALFYLHRRWPLVKTVSSRLPLMFNQVYHICWRLLLKSAKTRQIPTKSDTQIRTRGIIFVHDIRVLTQYLSLYLMRNLMRIPVKHGELPRYDGHYGKGEYE